MTTTDRLREDCGGARFLDLSGFLVILPFALVTSVLSSTPPDLASSWGWFMANAGALAVTGVVIIAVRAARRVWHVRLVPMALVVATGALVGATKGVSTSWFAGVLDLVEDPWRDTWGRGASATLLGAITVPALAALLAARDRWRDERELLLVELVRRSLDSGDRSLEGHRADLRRVLDHARTALRDLDQRDAASELHRLVDREIRPLSTRALAAAQPPPISHGWDLVRVAVRSEPWSVGIVVVLFTTTTWMLLIRHVGASEALGRSMVSAALAASTVWIGGRLRRRFPGAAIAVLVTMALTQAWGQSRLGNAAFGELEALSHPGITVLAALWLAELVVATAMITAARRQRDHIRTLLLDLLGPGGVRDAVGHGLRAVEGRQFALFLHGHLQNRLTAAAQHLERATDAADREAAMAAVLALLDEAGAPTPVGQTLSERLDEVIDRWRGLADIELSLDATVASRSDDVAERVANVVVEAITNAMRHGVAQRIDIAVTTAHDGGVTVVVTDDGFGPRRGRPGTGSRYLDVVTAENWTLTTVPEGGARLTARLDDALT